MKDSQPGVPLFAPWSNGSCIRDLKAACKRAKVPECSFNDLRRTFCSLLANAGVPMHIAAELMGHQSLDMVMRVYARISLDTKKTAVAKLPKLIVTKGVTNKSRKTADLALPATGTEDASA